MTISRIFKMKVVGPACLFLWPLSLHQNTPSSIHLQKSFMFINAVCLPLFIQKSHLALGSLQISMSGSQLHTHFSLCASHRVLESLNLLFYKDLMQPDIQTLSGSVVISLTFHYNYTTSHCNHLHSCLYVKIFKRPADMIHPSHPCASSS